jgi:hypothetical protein
VKENDMFKEFIKKMRARSMSGRVTAKDLADTLDAFGNESLNMGIQMAEKTWAKFDDAAKNELIINPPTTPGITETVLKMAEIFFPFISALIKNMPKDMPMTAAWDMYHLCCYEASRGFFQRLDELAQERLVQA